MQNHWENSFLKNGIKNNIYLNGIVGAHVMVTFSFGSYSPEIKSSCSLKVKKIAVKWVWAVNWKIKKKIKIKFSSPWAQNIGQEWSWPKGRHNPYSQQSHRWSSRLCRCVWWPRSACWNFIKFYIKNFVISILFCKKIYIKFLIQ